MVDRVPLLPYAFFSADSPDLPIRGPADPGGPDFILRAGVIERLEDGVVLDGATAEGSRLRFTVRIVAPGTSRILLEEPESEPRRSLLIRRPPEPEAEVSIEQTGQTLKIESRLLAARIDLDPFHMAFLDGQGRVLLEQSGTERDATDRLTVLPFGSSRVDGRLAAYHDTFSAGPDEHFYGFGEKFTGLDKRGQRLEMWHYDAYGVHGERSHKNVPFFVSTRGYGLFVDSTSAVHFDMAASHHGAFSLIVPDEALDYYVLAGPEPKDVIQRYAKLVGFPTLPPKWALGLWVSGSFQPDSQAAVLERARRLRAEGIPSDVLHIDCYWQRFGRWSEMRWDREAFPDPEGMIRQLKDLGFKVSLWMNPYLSVESDRFAEAEEKGYLLRAANGRILVAKLWGDFHPAVGLIDMTRPEAVAWFQSLLRPLLRMGVDVFKTDFGEGVPLEAAAWNGLKGDRLHNLYPLLYNDAVSEATAKETGRAGLVWARASHAGGQRHAAQWAGDPNCTFQAMASTLRGGLSLGACGHAFWSHDMGGFHGTPSPELYVRWSQLGFLSPLSRAHGRTSRLPWDFGPEALRIFREYARLRYTLLPYLYTCAVRSAEEGLPLLRAMVLEFPRDPIALHLDLQYMLGEDLLVAPVFNGEGRRPVYLPAGRWIDFWTREVIEGPATLDLELPLDRLPLHVRGNALIPTTDSTAPVTERPFDSVTFDAYLLDEGTGELRDLDGTTTVFASRKDARLSLSVKGPGKWTGIRLPALPGFPAVERVDLDGAALEEFRDVETLPLRHSGWCAGKDGTVQVSIHLG